MPGERAHRAGHDHHALGLERAGRDRGAHVALAVHHGREPAHLLDGVAGLVLEGALRPFADDEVAFDPAVLERLEHPHAEDGAGRAGHADDETPHSVPPPSPRQRPSTDTKPRKTPRPTLSLRESEPIEIAAPDAARVVPLAPERMKSVRFQAHPALFRGSGRRSGWKVKAPGAQPGTDGRTSPARSGAPPGWACSPWGTGRASARGGRHR